MHLTREQTMPNRAVNREAPSGFSGRRLAIAAAVAVTASVLATEVIRAIAVAVVTVPAAFTPLKASSVATLTILGVLAATGACAGLNRVSDRPLRTFRRVAPFALILSFAPDLAIWVAHAYQHTATTSTIVPLLVMHVTVATICITLLPLLGAERLDTTPEVRAGARL